MNKSSFKVDKSDFLLIQKIKNLKEKGFTDEDILQLDRNKEISKEEKQRGRQIAIEINKRRIKHYKRTIEHKTDQIYKKTPLEKHEGYKDELKPFFMLQNEIEEIEAQIEQMEEVNIAAQEEHDKCHAKGEKEEDK